MGSASGWIFTTLWTGTISWFVLNLAFLRKFYEYFFLYPSQSWEKLAISGSRRAWDCVFSCVIEMSTLQQMALGVSCEIFQKSPHHGQCGYAWQLRLVGLLMKSRELNAGQKSIHRTDLHLSTYRNAFMLKIPHNHVYMLTACEKIGKELNTKKIFKTGWH